LKPALGFGASVEQIHQLRLSIRRPSSVTTAPRARA